MKPFNLEKALAGDPVVTRGGQKITEIRYFNKRDKYKLLALSEDGDLLAYDDKGIFCHQTQPHYDLFMAPKPKKKMYFYAYPHHENHDEEGVFYTTNLYGSLELLNTVYNLTENSQLLEVEVEV